MISRSSIKAFYKGVSITIMTASLSSLISWPLMTSSSTTALTSHFPPVYRHNQRKYGLTHFFHVSPIQSKVFLMASSTDNVTYNFQLSSTKVDENEGIVGVCPQ